MISRNSRFMLMAALAIFSMVACKDDDDETETLPSLDGTLSFDVTEYINLNSPAETYIPKGVSHPEGGTIGYYWKVSPVMDDNDTSKVENGAFTYTFPDSLGTYTVSCTAFASGYYSKSTSRNVTTVDAEKSLEGMGFSSSDETMTDARDGKTYRTRRIGDMEWFRQNLAYEGTGTSYRDAKAMTDIFGRYYTWDEALTACPDGWRLPSEEDWRNLACEIAGDDNIGLYEQFHGIGGKMMTDAKFNGTIMWEYWPAVTITNESGLSMIPVGFANISGTTKDFIGVYEYAAFWTSSENEENEEQAYYRYLLCGEPDMMIGSGHKDSFSANIRCVKNN